MRGLQCQLTALPLADVGCHIHRVGSESFQNLRVDFGILKGTMSTGAGAGTVTAEEPLLAPAHHSWFEFGTSFPQVGFPVCGAGTNSDWWSWTM